MPSVTVRNISEETKGLLVRRAAGKGLSLEEELRRILDDAARCEAGNPDMVEPLGSFIARVMASGSDEFAGIMDQVVAERRLPDRAVPDFG